MDETLRREEHKRVIYMAEGEGLDWVIENVVASATAKVGVIGSPYVAG